MKVRFEDIQEKIAAYHPEADFDLLRRAYVFSAMAHRGQVRRSGEPYLTHPLEVAYILADLKLDVVSVVGGLLHDVIEDTLATREVIEEYFGAEVASLVEALSKISRITFTSEEEKQAENFRKMMLAMFDDIRVILVKLADRLHNMRTLEFLPAEKQERIARETIEIYAPLANRLGMGRIKAELEDLSLQHLDAPGFEMLSRKLDEQRRVSEEYISEIRRTIEVKLREAGVPAEIKGRVKHLYSIYKKMRVQHIDVDRVYDYVAFRIVTDTVKSCYAALGVIHGQEGWRPVPGRFKDFIAMPKPNLYQSLHTSVMTDRGYPFEVQIRTREMHAVAERGIAAHWKYKEGRSFDRREERGFQWIQRLLDLQKETKDSTEFLHAVKLDLYAEEVYTFTPRGEVRAFPRGATAIDFAYSIHSEVGNHCTGARINGRLVPIKSELKNGDVIEILTSPAQRPSRDWLGSVKTSHARHKIRHWLNAHERGRSLDVGRAMFERELKRYKLSLKTIAGDGSLDRALRKVGCETLDDFHVHVGYGKLAVHELFEELVPKDVLHPREEPQPPRPPVRGGDSRVRVSGSDDVLVSLARCCKPIRGDAIVGYITFGKGVSVHNARCPNVENLLFDPHRRIEVAWEGEEHEAAPGLYDVPIVVHTEDRPGMLAKLTSLIADERTNIRDVEARTTPDGKGRISLVIDVQDRPHLERVIEKLRSVEGVHHVERQMGA
ncbi:MAG TPA: bifunctional (p)ppGpp synthetase/guanosine-3',5'-bis(diphosphate) 3'-pyrophosphohydrolase [Verrucomicrobiae bacterium]|nr:bifunctional (p)ppGpp synthetase/guanosine-3',5'-bis(diphosphate) 3'-pyrophosphohydrolase [Verrucomicrobiae bacterium]